MQLRLSIPNASSLVIDGRLLTFIGLPTLAWVSSSCTSKDRKSLQGRGDSWLRLLSLSLISCEIYIDLIIPRFSVVRFLRSDQGVRPELSHACQPELYDLDTAKSISPELDFGKHMDLQA